MHTLSLPAPAKLNLFLHFIGRRADGYHLLQTVFQLLDFGDTLDFTTQQDAAITLITSTNIPTEQNLIWRAARLLQNTTQTSQGAKIKLTKRLPMGGGVGGGSSDAATTLVALNEMWHTQLSVDQLAELGKQLGADVPVFVRGQTAWGEGIGEILTPINLPEWWYLVIIPPCHVSTSEIFSHSQLTRNTTPITIANFLAGEGHNDFEPLVRKCYPLVDEALNWLGQFADAKLTGSGSSIFAAFSSYEQAVKIAEQIPASYKHFVAKGVNHSPLFKINTKTA